MTSIEQAYDDLLVPRIFAPWAEILLDYAGIEPGIHVLDVATGSGPVARAVARRIGSSGKVTATDIAAPMLDVARAKPASEGAAPITYIQAPAVPLPFETARFDLVTCQQSLQFFPDRLAALREMKRVLKPGARLAVAVWTGIAENEWFTAMHRALLATFGAQAAAIIQAPFRFPSAEALKSTIEMAGFRDVEVHRHDGALCFEQGIDQAIEALGAMPIAPLLGLLPATQRMKFEDVLRTEAEPLIKEGCLVGKMASNIAFATT